MAKSLKLSCSRATEGVGWLRQNWVLTIHVGTLIFSLATHGFGPYIHTCRQFCNILFRHVLLITQKTSTSLSSSFLNPYHVGCCCFFYKSEYRKIPEQTRSQWIKPLSEQRISKTKFSMHVSSFHKFLECWNP